jgi:hypothetical protein
MTVCVLFNDKGEFVNTIMAEPTDWVEEGWRLEEVPEGYFWNGKAIVLAGTMQNEVTPEVI